MTRSVQQNLQPLDANYRFTQIVGTGGIGSGIIFLLDGHETLRRNESRFGQMIPARDYCKLHIVFHYIATLLAPSIDGTDLPYSTGVRVLPIGRVGMDSEGQRLRQMMLDVGMSVEGVAFDPEKPTMFAVCLQYDDKSGGNVTTSVSASSQVSPEDVDAVLNHQVAAGREIVVALPEVPLSTRMHLLRKGRARGSFTIASVTSSEASSFRAMGGLSLTDLIALNMDEAAAMIGLPDGDGSSVDVVQRCVETLAVENADLQILITDGGKGSYAYKNGVMEYLTALPTEVVQSGGAGDAFLAGVIVGLSCGLPFLKGSSDTYFGETPLTSSRELGTLLASLSLTTSHSLYESLETETVLRYASRFSFSNAWQSMFRIASESIHRESGAQ